MGKYSGGFVLFCWLFLLYVTGIIVFTGGFLLKRSVVNQKSECVPNFTVTSRRETPFPGGDAGCSWIPRRFRKAVVILIDGLRYDFAVKHSDSAPYYHNRLSVFSDLIAQKPRNSRLFKFVADPPTTTMQRIKGIVTGSLPTFIDFSDNFASYEITEDNVIDHVVKTGKKVSFLGDDTWIGLFPGRFHRSHPFPSFNVKDLDTVDDGILKDLIPLIGNGSEWDVIVAHFLGVDHCGHTYGPNHPEMTRKLNQLNDMIRNVVGSLDDETVLFVFGDHGMTKTGDHGGDSLEEIESALFVHSTRTPLTKQESISKTEMNQIDFAATFSLLLGLPIPFGNLGTIVSEFFDIPESSHGDTKALYLNSKQVELYLRTYSVVSDDFTSRSATTNRLRVLMNEIDELFDKFDSNGNVTSNVLLKKKCIQYLSDVQTLCRQTWAKFDLISIIFGLLINSFALILTLLIVSRRVAVRFSAAFAFLSLGIVGTILALHAGIFPVFRVLIGLEFGILAFVMIIQVIGSYFLITGCSATSSNVVCSRTNVAALVVGVSLFCSYFSNSYVVSEDIATAFLAITLLWFNLLSQRRINLEKKRKTKSDLWVSHNVAPMFVATIVASFCIRLASVSWRCREEQWWCDGSPFLEAQMSSIPSDKPDQISHKNLRLLLSLSSLLGIVLVTRWLLRKAGNLNGFSPTVLCAAYCPVIMGFGIAFYWAMQGASFRVMPSFATVVPNAVFVVGAFGLFVLLVRPLCIHEAVETSSELNSLRLSGDKELLVPQVYRHLRANWEKHLHSSAKSSKEKKPLIVYGLATVFSAALLVAATIVVLLLVLVTRDGYAVSYGLLLVAIGAVLHSYSLGMAEQLLRGEQTNIWDVPWSWVVLWSLLSSVGFYATGHQQTFPTIHWDSAFVGSDGNFTDHTIPAIKLIVNTFSSTIIVGVCLPALLLWPISRQIVFKSGEPTGSAVDYKKGEFILLNNDAFNAGFFRLSCQYLAIHGIKLLGCMSAAALHRRHLMVWKIFAPRFVFESSNFVVLFPVILFCHLLIYSVHRALQRWLKEQEKSS